MSALWQSSFYAAQWLDDGISHHHVSLGKSGQVQQDYVGPEKTTISQSKPWLSEWDTHFTSDPTHYNILQE